MTQQAPDLTELARILRTDCCSVRCGHSALFYNTAIGEWVVQRTSNGHIQLLAETPLEESAVHALTGRSLRSIYDAIMQRAAWLLYDDQRIMEASSMNARKLEIRMGNKLLCITADMEEALDVLQTGKLFIKKRRKQKAYYQAQKMTKQMQTL